MRRFAFVAAIVLAALPAYGDVINLPGDRSATAKGFQIETQNATSVKTLVLNMVPNFDPEPDGVLPSDDFARVHEGICNAMARANASLIAERGISRFRAKWKWTPEQKPEDKAAGITVSRSHQSDFELDDNLVCFPVPNEVRLDAVRLKTPTGLNVRLRYIETSRKTGNLDLIYEIETPLEETDDALLSNASKELCILHADGVLAHRAKYYKQLDYQMVSIAFTQEEPSARTRGFLYQVENGACATGLSPELVKTIRRE